MRTESPIRTPRRCDGSRMPGDRHRKDELPGVRAGGGDGERSVREDAQSVEPRPHVGRLKRGRGGGDIVRTLAAWHWDRSGRIEQAAVALLQRRRLQAHARPDPPNGSVAGDHVAQDARRPHRAVGAGHRPVAGRHERPRPHRPVRPRTRRRQDAVVRSVAPAAARRHDDRRPFRAGHGRYPGCRAQGRFCAGIAGLRRGGGRIRLARPAPHRLHDGHADRGGRPLLQAVRGRAGRTSCRVRYPPF